MSFVSSREWHQWFYLSLWCGCRSPSYKAPLSIISPLSRWTRNIGAQYLMMLAVWDGYLSSKHSRRKTMNIIDLVHEIRVLNFSLSWWWRRCYYFLNVALKWSHILCRHVQIHRLCPYWLIGQQYVHSSEVHGYSITIGPQFTNMW